MIQVSNTLEQTLAPGQALSFDKITLRTKNSRECFNAQAPTSVKLCGTGIYDLTYSGNITGATAAAPVQLSIAVGGSPLIDTAMNSVPATAGDLNNVHTEKGLRVCCCDLNRVSIVNTGTNPVTVAANSNLLIKRYS